MIKYLKFLTVLALCMGISLIVGAQIPVKESDTNRVNITYGKKKTYKGKYQTLTLDIYFPKQNAGKNYPLALFMHGGGFVNGNKDAMKGHCMQMADSGFVAVSINYRKGWDQLSVMKGCDSLDKGGFSSATYRAMQDANSALKFLLKNADQFHINPNWIFVGGSSAGAITALGISYLSDDYIAKAYKGEIDSLGKLNESPSNFAIKGIANLWGALPDSTLITKKTALPTISFHGTADVTVPYNKGSYIPCPQLPEVYGSAVIYRQTRAANQAAILYTAVGGKHGPTEHTKNLVVSHIANFFHQVMQGKTNSGSYTNIKTSK